jgi:hypothetical protein
MLAYNAGVEEPFMKCNPGGYIPPSEVVGRDRLIKRLWGILERQSLVLSAERRIGKTCVITKMVAEAPTGRLPIYRDLEGIRTPVEFVETVFNDVEGFLGPAQKTAVRARQWLSHLSGLELGGLIKFPESIAPHWKTVLTKTVEDLIEQQESTVIFFWDELPLMLHNIKQAAGENAAMEVLDVLRSYRQMSPQLRMVFTGSIGLHNVISALRKAKYANDPTNDMHLEDVPPLTPYWARELARRLLVGEEILVDDADGDAVIEAIISSTDRVPFYIHNLIDQLKDYDGTISVETIEKFMEICLTDPMDRWHMRYFQERLHTYYQTDERMLAIEILDSLSTSNSSLSFPELFNRVRSHIATEDEEKARYVINLLQRDHYVVQHPDGGLSFRFPLIKRCWRLHRGLG